MPGGEAAAEQHEQSQPSTCLRPDGASPELPPLKDRQDFIERMEYLRQSQLTYREHSIYGVLGSPQSYFEERLRKIATEADQLVLMRAKQILDEAEERRQRVLDRVVRNPLKGLGA